MSEASAWRIEKAKYIDSWRSGEGAALAGGRWNSPDVPVIYSSQHPAMALMEILAHLPRPYHPSVRYFAIPIFFEGAEIETPKFEKELNVESKRLWGDDWVASGRSAILRVPSVIVALEWNFVLSPAHPEFQKITSGEPVPVSFDARLFT